MCFNPICHRSRREESRALSIMRVSEGDSVEKERERGKDGVRGRRRRDRERERVESYVLRFVLAQQWKDEYWIVDGLFDKASTEPMASSSTIIIKETQTHLSRGEKGQVKCFFISPVDFCDRGNIFLVQHFQIIIIIIIIIMIKKHIWRENNKIKIICFIYIHLDTLVCSTETFKSGERETMWIQVRCHIDIYYDVSLFVELQEGWGEVPNTLLGSVMRTSL